MTPAVSHSLLGMLALRTMSGYDVRKWTAETISYFWTEDERQIYPQLAQLAEQGFVQISARCQTGGPSRPPSQESAENNALHPVQTQNIDWDNQVYSLTPAGRAELERWLSEPPAAPPPRNEFLLKLLFGRYGKQEDLVRHLEDFHRRQAETLDLYSQVEQFMRRQHAKHPDLPYW